MLIIKTVLCMTRLHLMPKVSLKLTSQIILYDVLLALGTSTCCQLKDF